ncbi:histone-lysine N-methyltransferase setd3-like protein [Dinothrombium tinctorium]|uniref:protein-histidine N-methyltransferase n=1 Tax=Dinothrombium tinctorium TaxID=1965070 RepID=A0A3S3PAH4_9ACAR|nr:histone-lysine N-methyltransferase setd3-like protein [Dinothrombium tinctorium]
MDLLPSLYRWGISTTMTRQNFVPSTDGSAMINALIPLWDLCNHKSGKRSTDFSTENDAVLCYAMENIAADEEIHIFYGVRSNFEFLVHNGFVTDYNENDFVYLKLGISKNDPCFNLKTEICTKSQIAISSNFILTSRMAQVNKDLLAFLRVFHMNQGELENWKDEDKEELFSATSDKFKEIDKRIDLFLSTRCELLLKSYPPVKILGTAKPTPS